MPSANELIRRVRHRVRQIRHGTVELRLALGVVASLTVVTWLSFSEKLPPFLQFISLGDDVRSTAALVVGGVGLILLGWLVVRIWREEIAPELPAEDEIIRASSIKGLSSFGPSDGPLFRRLRRDRELSELLGYVQDPQVPLCVVMGESGAGKTSLLRSGLHYVLTEQQPASGEHAQHDFVYWEAMQGDTESSLLHAVRASGVEVEERKVEALLGLQAGRPCTIVLDQFEQLNIDDERHRPIFYLLAKASAKPAPHPITWVIAFREEYSPAWLKFCHAHGVQPPLLPVERFSKDDAAQIMATLGEETGIRFERRLLDDFLAAAVEEGRISPVDIGIGLLVLARLSKKLNKNLLTREDYEFAGRAQGLLAGYLQERLEHSVPKADRGQVLLAMLNLFDHDTNQRLAEGLSVTDLASGVQIPEDRLAIYATRLASRRERVLEEIQEEPTGKKGYRLPHERMIGALRRVSGLLLAEVDQARLRLEEAFRVWKRRPERRYLLSGRDLKQVDRHKAQILRGPADAEKAGFLRRSLGARLKRRGAFAGIALLLLAGAGYGYRFVEADRYRDDLGSWGLPRDLYDYQEQLEELSVSGKVAHLRWLGGASNLAKLIVSGGELENLDGLPASIQELGLDSHVHSLADIATAQGLTQLTLDVSSSQVRDLTALEKLPGLTQLTLDVSSSQVRDLPVWSALSKLEELRIVSTTPLEDAKSLASLKNLRSLTVAVDGTSSLAGLPESVRVLVLQ